HSKKDASKSIFSINGDVLDIKDESHSVHTINSIGMDEKNNFEIVFLQDNSYRQEIIKKAIFENLILLIIIAIITASVINYGSNIILNDLDESNIKLKKSQDRLKILNKNLQLEVEKEIKLKLKKELEANEKERISLHQSKLASMGEMIGNIAHQWRQPLTELSLVLINMELYFERSKMTKEKFQIKVKEANEQISFMSKTIDDFRNFFSSGKKKEVYSISYVIDQVKNLTNASLSNNNIALKYKIDTDYKLNGYPNEVAQAFLNIINNARDKFINEKNTNSLINIHAFIENSKKYITIEDNAGGIIVEPIEKVFEPYYSTKHAKRGTGIGLYMTKSIIEKNNNAKLSVHNSKDGAVFTIVF
ncbi:HAMP domain-containing sensor histidine kinase, partial [Sulfurimonas sp.]|uniref:sensor histidine kinase n=1 Tax=Sulfurimonas sp. TaxID=2022749 RepID=UPI0025E5C614